MSHMKEFATWCDEVGAESKDPPPDLVKRYREAHAAEHAGERCDPPWHSIACYTGQLPGSCDESPREHTHLEREATS